LPAEQPEEVEPEALAAAEAAGEESLEVVEMPLPCEEPVQAEAETEVAAETVFGNAAEFEEPVGFGSEPESELTSEPANEETGTEEAWSTPSIVLPAWEEPAAEPAGELQIEAQSAAGESVTEDEPAVSFAETVRLYFQQRADARKAEAEARELAETDAEDSAKAEDAIEYIDEEAEEEADDGEDVIEYVDEEADEENEENPLSIEEAEPAAPETEAEFDAEYAVEDESEIDLIQPQEAGPEEPVELAEAESSEAESVEPATRKGLVGSIASIFSRKPKETITLGLHAAPPPPAEMPEPASEEDGNSLASYDAEEREPVLDDEDDLAPIEPFEPEVSRITFSAEPGSVETPKTLAAVPVIPSLVEPFEPPAPEIEFQAMSPGEVAAERRRRIVLHSTSEWQTLGNQAQDDTASDQVQPPMPHRRKDDQAV
jgi:hypothetical protein